ncbi:hypothetical protein COOONC_12814 [Cooperia oncophora]
MHCSAGIGRTGCIIMIDVILRKLFRWKTSRYGRHLQKIARSKGKFRAGRHSLRIRLR